MIKISWNIYQTQQNWASNVAAKGKTKAFELINAHKFSNAFKAILTNFLENELNKKIFVE